MSHDHIEYHKPRTLGELFELLTLPKSYVYAGGTDLLVYLRDGKLAPGSFVDIKSLPELRGISEREAGIFIGAAESVGEVARHKLLLPYGALQQGARAIGCFELRTRATIGGNICNGSPSADSLPGLLVHNAKVSIISAEGQRVMALSDFLLAPGKVDLLPGEVLEGVLLPYQPAGAESRYLRRTRVKGMDLSGINAAVYRDKGGDIRIAIGALYPTTRRMPEAETLLSGHSGPLRDEEWQLVAEALTRGANPRRGSLRATPEYKKAMAQVLVRRALEEMTGGLSYEN